MAKKVYPPIPSHIRVTSKRDYAVMHIDEFKDPHQVGSCTNDPPQIIIKKGLSDKEHFSTVLHEVLHSLSFEHDINLTETQVLKLEKALFRLLTLNKWI